MPMQMRLTFASELLHPLLEFAPDDFIRPIFERMVPDAALWFARAGRPPARRRMDANRQPDHRDGSGNHGRGEMRAPRRTCHSQYRRLEVSLPKFYAAVESAVVKRRRTSASLMPSCPFLAIDRRNIKIDAIILR